MSSSKSGKIIRNRPSNNGYSIENTVEAFETRMARKLKHKDIERNKSEKEAALRQHLILEAMTSIRKALKETLRINLGDRFGLRLKVDDWEGWPRVRLDLVDSVAPNRVDYALIIRASDRKNMGIVNMSLNSGESLAQIHISSSGEGLEKLPVMLKRVVREFLDIIACYILDPASPEELVEYQSRPIEPDELKIVSNKLKMTDVFTEDFVSDKNVVKVAKNVSPIEDPMTLEFSEEEEEEIRALDPSKFIG